MVEVDDLEVAAGSHAADFGELASLRDRHRGHVTPPDVQSALSQPHGDSTTPTGQIKRAPGGRKGVGERLKHAGEPNVVVGHRSTVGVPLIPTDAIFVGHNLEIRASRGGCRYSAAALAASRLA